VQKSKFRDGDTVDEDITLNEGLASPRAVMHTLSMKFFRQSQGVTQEDVRWCYRHILKREPESEDVLTPHLAHRNFRELAESFASCSEATRFGNIDTSYDQRQQQPTASLDSPHPQHADVTPRFSSTATPAKVIACLERTQATLRTAGTPASAALQTDLPAKPTATHPTHLGEELVLSCHLRASHLPYSKMLLLCHDAVPLAQSLAQHEGNVEILSLAAPSINEHTVRHIFANTKELHFSVCDSASLKCLSPCDLLYSESTLQYCPPPLSAALVRAALRALRPGGFAILQILVEIDGYTFDVDAWLAAPQNSEVKRHALTQDRIYEIAAGQGCHVVMVYDDIQEANRDQKSSFFVIEKSDSAFTSTSLNGSDTEDAAQQRRPLS
jgi:SAM-dependent methyltransferase